MAKKVTQSGSKKSAAYSSKGSLLSSGSNRYVWRDTATGQMMSVRVQKPYVRSKGVAPSKIREAVTNAAKSHRSK